MEEWVLVFEPKKPKKHVRRFRKNFRKKVKETAKEKILKAMNNVLTAKMIQLVLDVTAKSLNKSEEELELGPTTEFVNHVSAVVLSYRFNEKRSKKVTAPQEKFLKRAAVEHLADCMDRMMEEAEMEEVEEEEVDDEVQAETIVSETTEDAKPSKDVVVVVVEDEKDEPEAETEAETVTEKTDVDNPAEDTKPLEAEDDTEAEKPAVDTAEQPETENDAQDQVETDAPVTAEASKTADEAEMPETEDDTNVEKTAEDTETPEKEAENPPEEAKELKKEEDEKPQAETAATEKPEESKTTKGVPRQSVGKGQAKAIILAQVQRQLRKELDPEKIRPLASEKIDELFDSVEEKSAGLADTIKEKVADASGAMSVDSSRHSAVMSSNVVKAALKASESFDDYHDKTEKGFLDQKMLHVGSVVLKTEEAQGILARCGIDEPRMPILKKGLDANEDLVELLKQILKKRMLIRLAEMSGWILFYMDQLFVMVTLANEVNRQLDESKQRDTADIIQERAAEINQNMELAIAEEVGNVVQMVGSLLDKKDQNQKRASGGIPEENGTAEENGNEEDDDNDDDSVDDLLEDIEEAL